MPRLNWHGDASSTALLEVPRSASGRRISASNLSPIYRPIYPQIDDTLPIEVILWSRKREIAISTQCLRRHLSWLAIWVFGRS